MDSGAFIAVGPYPAFILFLSESLAGTFAWHSPRQDQLSYQIIFFLQLLAKVIQFGFLIWTNAKVSFYWPATVGAKICGIRELKTTIQTISGHICPPYLSTAIISGGLVGRGTSHTIQLSSCLG